MSELLWFRTEECQNNGSVQTNVRIMVSHTRRMSELWLRAEEYQNSSRTEERQNYGSAQNNVRIVVPHGKMSEL